MVKDNSSKDFPIPPEPGHFDFKLAQLDNGY